ncbi:hypothetical protein [Tessaracoccus sp.]
MQMVTRRSALLGLGIGTMAVSGCSFTPVTFSGTTPPPPEPSKDPTVTLNPEFLMRATEGSVKTLPEGVRTEQRFSTPHLDGMLMSCFTGEVLSLASASQVGQTTPVRAPQGHELAAFTLRGGVPGFVETVDHAAIVALRIGDRRIPLPNLFNKFNAESGAYLTEWEMLCFCLPVGATIALEITDVGKTVVVDVRTGVPLIDEGWVATTGFRERHEITCDPEKAVFTRGFATLPPPGLEPDTGKLSLGLQPTPLTGLQPWTPALGWAPEGQQWLSVPMNVRLGWEGRVEALFTLQVPESFRYRDQDGEQPAVHPKSITTDQITTGQAELVVIWPVAGREGTSSFSFNAVGALEVDYAEAAGVPAQFVSSAQPLEFIVTMTPIQR